jgi:hypothetical protein
MLATEIEKLPFASLTMLSDEDDMSDDGDVDKKDEADENADGTSDDDDDLKLDEEEVKDDEASGLEE